MYTPSVKGWKMSFHQKLISFMVKRGSYDPDTNQSLVESNQC